MEATKEELEWAIRIKEAAVNDPTINEAMISDFEYLHHAIVAKGVISKAMKRLRNMQYFKEQNGIQLDGSLEQANRDMERFLTSHPGLLLSIDRIKETGVGVICARYAALHVQRIHSPEAFHVVLRAMFYVLQASHANVHAMRAGCALLFDMQAASGLRNFSWAVEDRAAQLYAHAYPTRVVHLVNLRTPWLFRVLFRLLRPLLSQKVRDTTTHTAALHEWLATSPYPRHVLPVEWGGTLQEQRLLKKLKSLLRERYDNAAKFRLSEESKG